MVGRMSAAGPTPSSSVKKRDEANVRFGRKADGPLLLLACSKAVQPLSATSGHWSNQPPTSAFHPLRTFLESARWCAANVLA
jgi:hypothetical protein